MNETEPLPSCVTPSPAIRHLFSGNQQNLLMKEPLEFLEDIRENVLKDDRHKRRLLLLNDAKWKK